MGFIRDVVDVIYDFGVVGCAVALIVGGAILLGMGFLVFVVILQIL